MMAASSSSGKARRPVHDLLPWHEQEVPGPRLDRGDPREQLVSDRVSDDTDAERVHGVLVVERREHLSHALRLTLVVVEPSEAKSRVVNCPGYPGGSRSWKRGWSHGTREVTWGFDHASVLR
jgi:hypothetical protein